MHLFNDSVANNIAYAAEEKYSRDEIKQAARIAHADDFVRKMPEGYDTVIGENGASLSGGQRQLHRHRPRPAAGLPGVLLDEATSALDTESEATSRRPSTSSAGAHFPRDRPPPLHHREGGRDLVIDEGHIVERGNHHALMDMHGTACPAAGHSVW